MRTISGAVFVSLIVGSILMGQYYFLLLFFIISILSELEFYKLAKNYGVSPSYTTGLLMGISLYATTALILTGYVPLYTVLIVLPLASLIFTNELYRESKQPFLNIAITLLGVIYGVVPFVLLALAGFYGGMVDGYSPHILLGILILQWSSDTGQYLTGRSLGKHPLFKRISPKKSWEGFIGGFIFTLGVAWLLAYFYNDLTITNWMITGAIIVIFGTLGDLTESMLKRSIDVKDSGNIMPGHGGVLDRFDGLIGAMPFVYFYLAVFC
jgi:phosphatidate cytidylyltransferase